MAERKTRVRGAQVLVKSIQASDLSGVGETVGFIATVQADETIAYVAPTGGSGGGSTFKQTFVTGDLTADKITITHNLDTAHPQVIVYNNLDNVILPTETTYLTDDTIELDFTGVTPLTGTYKVRVFGATGSTGGFRQTFSNSDLSSGVLSVNHNLNEKYVFVDVYDNDDLLIVSDEITLTDADNLTIDLSTFAPISSNWNVIATIGGSGGSSSGNSIQDADNDTKVEVEKNSDEDIIRFTAFNTQEAQIDVNGLTLKTGASINEFSTDGTLADDSDDAAPTEKAVKTYVDTEIAAISTTAIQDADGNTKIQTEESANENIIRFDIDGTEQIILQDGALLPTTDDDIDLGSASKKFKDLYLTGTSLHLGNTTITETNYNAVQNNIVLNAFRIAINGSLTQFNMIDGIVDEYEDEDGIDNPNSTNESYDSVNDLYNSSPGSFESNADIEDEDMTDISDWAETVATNSATTSQVTFDGEEAMKLSTGTTTSSSGARRKDVGTFGGTRTVVTLRVYLSNLGAFGSSARFHPELFNGSLQVNFNFFSDGLYAFDGSTNNEVGTDLIVEDTWQEWTFDVDWSAETVDIYLDGILKASGVDAIRSTSTADGTVDLKVSNAGTTNDVIAYIDFFKAGSDSVSSGLGDMTLISESFTAQAQPDTARIILFEEDVDSITLNTDLKAFVTRDAGQTFTTDFATDDKLDITSHGFSNNNRIMVTSSAQDLPVGLDSATVYYVINATTNDFELSLTSGGGAVDITDDGTGTHTAKQVNKITLANDGEYESGKNILTGSVDISGQPSGTSMEYQLVIANEKELNIHGTGLSWD